MLHGAINQKEKKRVINCRRIPQDHDQGELTPVDQKVNETIDKKNQQWRGKAMLRHQGCCASHHPDNMEKQQNGFTTKWKNDKM